MRKLLILRHTLPTQADGLLACVNFRFFKFAALWLIHPDKLNTLLSVETFTEGGLVPRLLACHTRAEPQMITAEGTPAIPGAVRAGYHP